MSNKVENMFNLTNYRDHPENLDYKVFFFFNLDQANYFESKLKEEGINYESFLEKENEKELMLFGIHKRDYRRAQLLNDLSFAAFKKPFIANKIIRNSILAITLAFILFALIGFILSK